MHLWHKWKTVRKFKTIAIASSSLTHMKDVKHQVIGELQQCAKCGAERGRIHTLDRGIHVVDAEFMKGSMQ